MNLKLDIANSPEDIEQILRLQQQNLKTNLSVAEALSNGFVTVRHEQNVLAKMASVAPQIIAKDENYLIAYALTMPEAFAALVPVLQPMFDSFKNLTFRDKKIPDYNYYVMGQICIAEGYRGIGLFDQLYAKHKTVCGEYFDLCVTEISARNARSLRAHARVGFQTIHTFRDATDDWHVVAWDWK